MAARPSWEGFLKLSLISVPVRAYTATVSGGGKIGFHMLHAKCGNRIRYKKVCPVHGEVSNDEIVPGYEYAKNEYVVVEPEELEKVRTESDKGINIDAFIAPGVVDRRYDNGRSYYLVPSGKVGQHPYAVLQNVMAEKKRQAIARVIFSGKEQIALIRPVGRLLTMTLLYYDEQVKKPSAFEDEIADVHVSEEERKLAESLVEASTAKKFDFSRYGDLYTERLSELIEAKAKGKRIAAPRTHEEPAVINLMDALRKSLDRARKGGEAAPASKNGHQRKHRAATSRRKTG